MRCNGTDAGQVLYGLHTGLGDCALFQISNSASAGEAVEARTNGTGNAVEVVNTGTGRAGWFQISNSDSSAECIAVRNNGKGHAGEFRSTSSSAQASCLSVQTETNLGWPAIQAYALGSRGFAGVFRIFALTNTYPALWVRTESVGLACLCEGHSLVDGDLEVRGGLTPSATAFKIDHPLDPGNRYLQLPAVHSAEMKNVFDGLVVLDQKGEAWAQLPDWFEAANGDFRYQLTAIGGPAPELHVAQEITDNAFLIAGGPAGLKVSWQVTGIRQDPYALLKPVAVEVDKPPHEVGRYRHPEAYGLPAEFRVDHDKYEQYLAASADGEEVMVEVPEEDERAPIDD